MAGVQVRYATPSTSEEYVTGKLWCLASLAGCPWHPAGGCGFARHGSYPRIYPPGTRIARWYCPTAQRTVSALPDCLASHRSGTLDELEATVRAVEQAPSLAAAVNTLRTDIELPGALRYLSRLCAAIHESLKIIRGLEPLIFCPVEPTLTDFAAALKIDAVLPGLRARCEDHLALLPTPLGFNPHRIVATPGTHTGQHRAGRDPPVVFADAPL